MRMRGRVRLTGGVGAGGGRAFLLIETGRGAIRLIPTDPVSRSSQQPIQLGLQFGLDRCSVTLCLILGLNLVGEQCHALTQ